MTLLIDTREKSDTLIDLVISTAHEAGYACEMETLKVGDFVWDDAQICIEHKSTRDFLQSLISGRLYSQLRDMACYPYPYLFIEGDWPYHMQVGRSRLSQKMVAGMMCGVMYHFPYIMTVYWPSEVMFAQSVISLRNRADETGPKVDIIKRTPSKTMHENPNLAAYLSMPGIGHGKAESLMDRYGSFYTFLQAYAEDPKHFSKKGNTIPKSARTYVEGILGY